MGIPDTYDGNVIAKHWTSVNNLPTYTTGYDLYIVQIPIPGVAYFYGERTAGGTGLLTLTPVFYSDSSTLFPSGNETSVVQAARHASQVIEIVPTVNDMTWSGSIMTWKGRIELQQTPILATGTSSVADGYTTTGFSMFNSMKPSNVFSFKDGIYVPSFNSDDTYEWTNTISGLQAAAINENNLVQTLSGEQYIQFAVGSNFPCITNFETTVIKFPALAASQTALIRTWTCQEYQVNPSSILYDYSHSSPDHDPVAMQLLKSYHRRIPCGVCRAENASFWNTFLSWARNLTKVGSYMPGPIGAISKGAGDLLDFGHGLW